MNSKSETPFIIVSLFQSSFLQYYYSQMKVYCLVVLALMVVHSLAHLAPYPNEQCMWRGYKTCPIETSGSDPVCDFTTPTEVSPGVFGMKICASETPRFVGGKFEVGLAMFGTILTVDVIPQESEEGDNNINCTSGQ